MEKKVYMKRVVFSSFLWLAWRMVAKGSAQVRI